MHYYTFEFDDESAELCTINTPYGLYRYKRLPMGVSQAPDIAQEITERVLDGIEDVEKYIDDIALFSNDWKSHVQPLDTVFKRLEEKGFSINPLKCEFGVKESDFLGHWLTPTGIKPLRKKIQGILDMKEPTNLQASVAFFPWHGNLLPGHVATTVAHPCSFNRSVGHIPFCMGSKAS